MLTRTLFNILSILPLFGFILFFSFLPVANWFGAYDGRLFGNDPKDIGLPELYHCVRGGVLPSSCVLLLLALVVLIIVKLSGHGEKLSTWSVWTVIGTFLLVTLLLGLDPGGYVFWFFD